MRKTRKQPAAALRRTAWGGALAAALVTGSVTKTARACAVVPAFRDDDVSTRSEEAFIVWDEKHQIEHFVRTAKFELKSPSFGFIVPVPNRPTLAEADASEAFEHTESYLEQTELVPHFTLDRGVRLTTMSRLFDYGEGAPRPPSIVEHQTVAGLDATVLAARDAEGLDAWLADHHLPMRDALQRWISRYVAKGWYFVLFRYVAGPPANERESKTGVAIRSVRITFPTDRPIYPYLEPDDVPFIPHRVLHLYLLSSHEMVGQLAAGEQAWIDRPSFSREIDTAALDLPRTLGVSLPPTMWLTNYVDYTTKRPPSDLDFYTPFASRRVEAEPVTFDTEIPVPVDLLGAATCAGLVSFFWWRRRRRLRRVAAEATAT